MNLILTDNIDSYLGLYFTANDVPDDNSVPILLSSIGASTYSLLSDLLAPDKPGGKTYAEITTALKKHFEPQRSVITERFHFHKRNQSGGENIAEFDAALRKLAIHCDFKGNLEEALRDQFLCGIHHDAVQQRLLSESKLTYVKAPEIAKGMESADKHS